VIAVVLAWSGLGLGLAVLAAALWPSRPPLELALAPLRAPAEPLPSLPITADPAWRQRLGETAARVLRSFGIELRSVRADLAIMDRSLEWLCAEKTLDGLVVLLLVPGMAAVVALAGIGVPLLVPLWAALVLAAGAFMVPDLRLRLAAEERRRQFRHALGVYLDLVAISLAGGAAAEEALRNALADGQGWAFTRLRDTLADAHLEGTTPWEAMGRLGRELRIGELVELAGSVALAGTEGATVRRALTARAVALRARQLAEAETRAVAATDRMVFPAVMLLFGFITFVIFPALMRAIAGF
jgi:Flp pilus assembly protein TadB